MKKSILFCAAGLLLSAAVFAQSSEKLTELINTDKATFGQISYLAGVYTGKVAEDADYDTAVKTLSSEGIIGADKTADTEITLAELSYLCMKTTGLKGGLFYSIFPGPRYAFRELKAKNIIPPAADPSEKVTGRDAIAVLNGCLPQDGE